MSRRLLGLPFSRGCRCSSTKLWTTWTGSKRAAPGRPMLWASYSTMGATASIVVWCVSLGVAGNCCSNRQVTSDDERADFRPLGMQVGPMTFIAVLGVGPTYHALIIWLIINVPFFFNTWEHYHTHHFVLGPVNGPSDGLLMISVLMVFAGFYGTDILWVQLAYGLTVWETATAVMAVGGILTVAHQLISVAQHLYENNRSDELPAALLRALPFGLLVACSFGFYFFTPELFVAHTRIVFAILGGASTELTLKLMGAHIGDEEYRGTLSPVMWAAVVPMHSLIRAHTGIGLPGDYDVAILAATAVGTLAQMSMLSYNIVVPLADALDVSIFRIPNKKQS